MTPESENQWYQHIIAVIRQQGKHTCDLKLKREDGSLLYAAIESIRKEGSAEEQGVKNRTHVVHMVVSDITERKKAEDELLSSQARFQAFMRMCRAVFHKDEEGRHVYANEKWQSYFDLLDKDWKRKTVIELLPQETVATI